MTTILSIVIRPLGRDYEGVDGHDYIREPLQAAELVVGHGIDGDSKAGRHPDRQVNLVSSGWLAAAAERGYRAAPGQFGEQIIIDDLDLLALPVGAQLRLGESAVLEITKGRNGCKRLEAAQDKSIEGLGPVGVMTQVISGGTIRVGDAVHLGLEIGD